MANKKGSWTGFEDVSKAKRYLKKHYDKVFKNNTDEYKQLKELFKKAKTENREVGVLSYECACGWTGEDPVLVALSPEDPQLIKYKSDEKIMHLCPLCRELGYFLQHYGLSQKNAEQIFPVILHLKKQQGVTKNANEPRRNGKGNIPTEQESAAVGRDDQSSDRETTTRHGGSVDDAIRHNKRDPEI